MIDETKFARIREQLGAPPPRTQPSTVMDLGALSVTQLSQLRDDINAVLPTTDKMDLHRELATQYAVIKEYQTSSLGNEEVPPNQMAQIMNSTVAALAQLIKLQETLKREETFKMMEGLMLEAVTMMDEEAREHFFKGYEELAKAKGLAQ